MRSGAEDSEAALVKISLGLTQICFSTPGTVIFQDFPRNDMSAAAFPPVPAERWLRGAVTAERQIILHFLDGP